MTLDDHQGMLIPTMGEIVEEAIRGDGPAPLLDTLDAVYSNLTPEQQVELDQWLADNHEARAWNLGDNEPL